MQEKHREKVMTKAREADKQEHCWEVKSNEARKTKTMSDNWQAISGHVSFLDENNDHFDHKDHLQLTLVRHRCSQSVPLGQRAVLVEGKVSHADDLEKMITFSLSFLVVYVSWKLNCNRTKC